MRLVFMGTPEFAAKSLELLHASRHEIIAVVTAVDKPRGRGRKISQSAVKRIGFDLGLPVLQPANLKDPEFIHELKNFKPDLIAVVAFRILPEAVYSLPRLGSINLHASLLPQYRGAAPINWALINGESRTGVTTFKLDKKVDTGGILLQKEVEIDPEDNFGSLHDKLMVRGAELLLETIDAMEDGKLAPSRQNDNEATPAPKLTSRTGLIDWRQPAANINNLIRGLAPYPGAYSFLEQKKMTILKTAVIDSDSLAKPGIITESSANKGITIACGENSIFIEKLKPQGKNVMGSAEFVRGYHVKAGDKFGN